MENTLDLSTATDTMVETLKVAFPAFKTIMAEDERTDKIDVPALLVQITELEPDPDRDNSTGEWPCLVHVEARVVYGYRTAKVRREVARAAGAVAAFAHNDRLGVKWGPGVVIACNPDDFSPQANQFDVWLIEWVHQADIGPRFTVEEGVVPAQVLSGWSPKIGDGNDSEYLEVAGDE